VVFRFNKKETYYQNDYCEYWIEDGIVYEIFKPTFDVLTLEIAKVITQDRLAISNGTSRPLYVELGSALKMEKAANKYLSSGEAMQSLTATGILVSDQIQRFGASLYTKFFKPKIPTKFFTNKESAVFWLTQFKTESMN
jgi:hypothetical protein